MEILLAMLTPEPLANMTSLLPVINLPISYFIYYPFFICPLSFTTPPDITLSALLYDSVTVGLLRAKICW
jgi:hypothetical protein